VAPWLDEGRPSRRTVTSLLFVAGFAVSASTLLVSTRAQLLQSPPQLGPDPVRQYALIPRAVRDTFAGPSDAAAPDRYLDLWQVVAARTTGVPGAVLASVLTAGLLLALLAAGRRLSRQLLDADGDHD
jgi:hypothetical protein